MRRTIAGRLAVAAAVVAVLAGCGGGGKGAPVAASSAPTYGCLTPAEAAEGAVTVDGPTPVDAYFRDSDAGGAKVAVVFSHQNGGTLCDWIPYLDSFTRAGYAVMPFTANGNVSDGIAEVAAHLRTRGVTTLVLLGASKGGTGSLVAGALPDLPLPAAAVVSLSGPEYFGGDSASSAVTRLRAPAFFAAEENDQPFADSARTLHAAAVSAGKQLKIYPGGNHGAALLSDGALPDVLAFLAHWAPPHA